jgi:hypothetical protein
MSYVSFDLRVSSQQRTEFEQHPNTADRHVRCDDRRQRGLPADALAFDP